MGTKKAPRKELLKDMSLYEHADQYHDQGDKQDPLHDEREAAWNASLYAGVPHGKEQRQSACYPNPIDDRTCEYSYLSGASCWVF